MPPNSSEATPPKEPPFPPLPAPTLANVPYGDHERQVLDFWKAESSRPTPVLFYIHGGGWLGKDKSFVELPNGVGELLDAGISVVSINYRYVKQTILTEGEAPGETTRETKMNGILPPVKAPMDDIVRALQFIRTKAAEWNLDKSRIGASGGSAGACSCLWLAFHEDMADPTSLDPVARESSRLCCAAVTNAQTSLDPKQMKEWTPNSRYGGHAFGFAWNPNDINEEFREFLAKREQVLPWILEYSPYAHVTANVPPVYLFYTDPPALGEDQEDPTHTANFGVKLAERLAEVGAQYELVYPGVAGVLHASMSDYLLDQLRR